MVPPAVIRVRSDTHPTFADRFLTHMPRRSIRIEEELVDPLFNSTEEAHVRCYWRGTVNPRRPVAFQSLRI
jgi:hypothetical protein